MKIGDGEAKLREERDGLAAMLICVLEAIGGAEEISHRELWKATAKDVKILQLDDRQTIRVEVVDR